MKTGFFAYSGQPNSVGESVEEAIKLINGSEVALLKSWKSYAINGKLIVDEVTIAIDESDYFCADLTGFSDNVLFELGYAIAKNKFIFLILDNSHIESVRRYKELSCLTTTGYKKYVNSLEIVEAFTFYISNSNSQTNQRQRQKQTKSSKPLLFLKNQFNNTYSQVIDRKIGESKIPYTTDDPSESKVQPIDWYLEHLNTAVLIEFSATSRKEYELQNSKCSLVAGLALGYGLDLLMVAEEPYEVPIDYRDLLITYNTKDRCTQIVSEFLKPLNNKILELLYQRNISQTIKKRTTELQQISFGEFLAEHESDELPDYYVETFNIQTLTKNDSNIVIGRKGTGKTATLYYLKSILEEDTRNHVCLIKPDNVEIDALVKILQVPSEEYERSYLVESVWKLLIYTEVAQSIYHKITLKPLYAVSPAETAFKEFVEENTDLILKDFSERLEEELENIRQANIINKTEKIAQFKIKLAELIHQETLAEIKNHFSELFPKNRKIFVLIDNLDKSWKKDNKLKFQSELILGLLSVTEKIVKDLLSFRVKGQQKHIDFHLTIFLRSDIFKYILDSAREPDKVEYTNLLRLGDREVLFRIIEQRFIELSKDQLLPENLWDKYIVKTVDELLVKNYIYEKLIPRPRDIIYFLKNAHEIAISRGHTVIEKEDLKLAYTNYSSWVVTSMMVENGITLDKLREFLYQLVGSPQVVDREFLYVAMSDMNLSQSEEDLDKLVENLSTLSILGKEVSQDEFEFEYAFDSKDIINAKSKKFGSNRYKIHNALIPYLSLDS
ncbi:P-loop ATPase, Sll1717 family [Nodularia sp. NIES-3585]|uniref:P-loop ATPase, Sll1717 family n=1 Tax=Nodularia sp. NIES-3585 TaxID=1973477 RepID=UPI000B5CB00B|nr:hypothetical protein [Nodularia sp. NIES-3585]GAX39034.1 hypothetical protein NIES3585_50860 [Nodularia sp. NIES-3585]